MLTLIPETKIDFVGKRYLFFMISGVLLLSGLTSLIIKKGPRKGIDFTGGHLIEVRFDKPLAAEELRKMLTQNGIEGFEIQSVPKLNSFIIRVSPNQALPQNQSSPPAQLEIEKQVRAIISQSFPDNTATYRRTEFVGPAVGEHLLRQAVWAIIFSFAGIILYVAFRFHSLVWGASGILALAHDVFVTLGIFSILNKEITITVIAALLTLAGYSINDTIVIFDRMREKLRLLRTEPLSEIINRSVNETMSRTVITTLTVFLAVLSLYFFGGEVIHDFALALLIGVIAGSYSTIAVAAPLVYEWERIRSQGKVQQRPIYR